MSTPTEPRPVCGAPNGAQSCGEPLGHDGQHVAKVNVGGREYVAPWNDEDVAPWNDEDEAGGEVVEYRPEPREALVELIDESAHADWFSPLHKVADAILAAGWRPPLLDSAQPLSREELGRRVADVCLKWAREDSDRPGAGATWETLDGRLRELYMRVGEVSETEKVAAELRSLAKQFDARGHQRDEIGDDDPTEDDTCAEEGLDCHTVSAVATWLRAAGMLRRRADELSPPAGIEVQP